MNFTSWATTYMVATFAFTMTFFFVLAPLLDPPLMWEAVFYWCMIFVPPLLVIDLLLWFYARATGWFGRRQS